MADCIFCMIINGDIPSTKVYEDEYVYAFRDINPQAPVHVLVVPKVHIACTAELSISTEIHPSAFRFSKLPRVSLCIASVVHVLPST